MCVNIDLFNKCCVAILGKLYGHFPVPIRLQTTDVATLTGLEAFDGNAGQIYAETVTFLHQEGYLSISDTSKGSTERVFFGVRLTSNGLAALNRTPKELDNSPSVGERIAGWTGELIKDASREAIKGAVQALLG